MRDTISRVFLGMVFGFVAGIVMYQAAGIDAGVLNKNVLIAQTTTCSPACGANEQCVGDPPYCTPLGPNPGCVVGQDPEDARCCRANNMGGTCVGADGDMNRLCCDPGLICQGSGGPQGVPICVSASTSLSSSASPPPPPPPPAKWYSPGCSVPCTRDDSGGTYLTEESCNSTVTPCSTSSSVDSSSSLSSSSPSLCCDTATNSCVPTTTSSASISSDSSTSV